jgi:hypothetical protein
MIVMQAIKSGSVDGQHPRSIGAVPLIIERVRSTTAQRALGRGELPGLRQSELTAATRRLKDARLPPLPNLMIAKQAIRIGKLVGHRPRNIGVVPTKTRPVMYTTARKVMETGRLPGANQSVLGAATGKVKAAQQS